MQRSRLCNMEQANDSHNHDDEHNLLFIHCSKCGSPALTVAVMEGALLFDCADCKEEVGMMEDIQKDSQELLAKGCDHNH